MMSSSYYYYHHCDNHFLYQYLFMITDDGYSHEWVFSRSFQENQVLIQYPTILLRSATEYISFLVGSQNATSSHGRFTSKKSKNEGFI